MFCRNKRQRDEEDADDAEIAIPLWLQQNQARREEHDIPEIIEDNLQPDPQVEEEAEYFEPRELPSRRKERKRLGKAGQRSECFLCSHVGEKNTTVPDTDVQKLVEMLRENTGRMDSSILAEMVSEHYNNFRRTINARLRPGEKPLPYMSPGTVLEHIRCHHQDPEVKIIVILEELQELREELVKGVLEKHKRTKHRRGNKTQIDCLERVIKLELTVQSKDPAKMFGYSAGARINSEIHKQGAIAVSSKNLFSYWRNAATH